MKMHEYRATSDRETYDDDDFTPTREELFNGEREQLIHPSPRRCKICTFEGLSQRTSAFVVRAGLAISLGGLMFGYDLGNVAGILPMLKKEMNFDRDMLDSFVAMLPIGAISGTVIGGWMCDAVGRKKSILITCVILIVGGLLQSMATSFVLLCAGRFIVGIGIAISAIADVSYLNEVSPTSTRGALTSCNEFMVSMGFLVSYVVAVSLDTTNWRWLFGIIPIVALLQGLLVLNMPESLRWLYNKGRHLQLRHATLLVYDIKGAENYLDLLKSEEGFNSQQNSAFKTTTGKGKSLVLAYVIAALLMIFQQLTCNSNVLSFGSLIFPDNGMATNSNNFIITIGVVKVFFTGVALILVDKVGRRPLLCVGISVMCYSLATLCFSVSFMESSFGNFMARSAIYVLVASYSLSYGTVSWLVVSEIFPCSVRGRALAFAQCLNWLMNASINAVFLHTLDRFGYSTVYGAYFLFTFLGLVFICMLVPETRGKCPEEVQY